MDPELLAAEQALAPAMIDGQAPAPPAGAPVQAEETAG